MRLGLDGRPRAGDSKKGERDAGVPFPFSMPHERGSAPEGSLHLARLANESLNQFLLTENARAAFEAMRGKSGKLFGHQTALFSLLKSAPLAVAKDLQEINPILFETADTLKDCLQMTSGVVENLNSLAAAPR